MFCGVKGNLDCDFVIGAMGCDFVGSGMVGMDGMGGEREDKYEGGPYGWDGLEMRGESGLRVGQVSSAMEGGDLSRR